MLLFPPKKRTLRLIVMFSTFHDMIYIFQRLCACRSIWGAIYVNLSWIKAEIIFSEAVSFTGRMVGFFPADLLLALTCRGWPTADWLGGRPQALICRSHNLISWGQGRLQRCMLVAWRFSEYRKLSDNKHPCPSLVARVRSPIERSEFLRGFSKPACSFLNPANFKWDNMFALLTAFCLHTYTLHLGWKDL